MNGGTLFHQGQGMVMSDFLSFLFVRNVHIHYFTGMLLLLLLLSRFSHVQLYATPWTAAHQAPLSLGFSRQEHWSGLPFPFPMHESESEVAQSCPTLSNPMDCSPPGSSVHGISRQEYWSGVPLPSPTHTMKACHFHEQHNRSTM